MTAQHTQEHAQEPRGATNSPRTPVGEVGPAGASQGGSWRDDAACVGHDPEIFFPESKVGGRHRGLDRSRRVRQAQAICATCPVAAPCAEEALTTTDYRLEGIWGGTTDEQRKAMRRTT